MKRLLFVATTFALLSTPALHVRADRMNIAEDDASHSTYNGGWQNEANGGSGFGPWTLTSETQGENSHAGFFIANTSDNQDLTGIAREDKAFGLFANGSGFEQAVAFRPLEQPLEVGDSFSFMMENGRFEKKGDKDDPTPASAGLVLRSGKANSSTADYNQGARFEFGFYHGQDNFQIHDAEANSDTGVKFVDSGVTVTVTLTGADTYDVEIQTMPNGKLTKLSGRKLKGSGTIDSMAVFNRNGERHDVYFNQFQISRDAK
jgi:hypothetical protein